MSFLLIIFIQSKFKSLPNGVEACNYDFDHPSSLSFDEIYDSLKSLKNGNVIQVPEYSFITNSRNSDKKITIHPNSIIVFEGILSMHDERIRDLMDLKIFIVCDEDLALARRITRDIKDRGRDVKEVLTRYNRFIKHGFQQFVKPQMKYADLIIPGGANNDSFIISCS